MSAKVSLDALEALAEHEPLPLANCTRTAPRFKGNQFVLNETKVAAIRSANGWEASVLHGLQVCCTSHTDSIIPIWTVIHIDNETLLS